MILRGPHNLPVSLLSLFFLLSSPSFVQAEDSDPFNCHVTSNGLNYDLTKLAGEHTISRTRDTPPSTMVDSLRFDLCADLKAQDGVAEADQCPSGTRACLTKVNKKGDDKDRIVAVIPIAQTSSLKPSSTAISSPQGLSILLHGASYPSTPNATPLSQSLNITLLCNPDTTSDPIFSSYNGSILSIEWTAPAGCGSKGEGNGGDDKESGDKPSGGDGNEGKKERVGSGVGWFFLVLILAFLTYFGLGAYYNYSTYGASGVDLIPHRDFWQEVPYMVRDVVSHLCSAVRPRRSVQRGGYIAV